MPRNGAVRRLATDSRLARHTPNGYDHAHDAGRQPASLGHFPPNHAELIGAPRHPFFRRMPPIRHHAARRPTPGRDPVDVPSSDPSSPPRRARRGFDHRHDRRLYLVKRGWRPLRDRRSSLVHTPVGDQALPHRPAVRQRVRYPDQLHPELPPRRVHRRHVRPRPRGHIVRQRRQLPHRPPNHSQPFSVAFPFRLRVERPRVPHGEIREPDRPRRREGGDEASDNDDDIHTRDARRRDGRRPGMCRGFSHVAPRAVCWSGDSPCPRLSVFADRGRLQRRRVACRFVAAGNDGRSRGDPCAGPDR